MTDHTRWGEDIPAYALGALDADAAREVERHLSECEQCRRELPQLRAVVDVLPLAAQPPTHRFIVSESVKRDIMLKVRPKRSYAWVSSAAAIVCAAAAIILGTLYVSLRHVAWQLSHDDREKTVAIQALLSTGSASYRVSHGQVVIKGERAYIVMQDLQTLRPHHVYQVWTQESGSRVMSPSVTFDSQGGVTLVTLPQNARSLVAIAVSIEPPGGSAEPTTKPIFLLKLRRTTAML